MKKRYFLRSLVYTALAASGVLFWSASCLSQTTVGGLISSNTTWTASGSPYIVDENLLIDIGVTLTIDPHVTIKFNSEKALLVRGTLRAIGGPDNYITLTSNQPTPQAADWGYISFDNESTPYDSVFDTGCIMDYCIVEYAGHAYSYAIGCSESFPKISHSYIRNNYGCAFQLLQIISSGTQVITHNIIEKNNRSVSYMYGFGFYACVYAITNENSYLIFTNNIIRNNGWLDDPILSSYTMFNFSPGGITFTDNIIVENAIGFAATIHTYNGIIERNLFCKNSCLGGYPTTGMIDLNIGLGQTISHNIIVDNQKYIEALQGSIILSLGDFSGGPDFIFSENSVIRNSTKNTSIIYPRFSGDFLNNTICQNFSTLDFDNTVIEGSGTYFNLNHCNIFNNYSNQNTLYSYQSSFQPQNLDFNADNNYWGYTSTNSIDSVIYDYFDDLTTGVVHYTPFLTEPDLVAPVSPPLNFIKSDLGNNNVQLTWSSNPESDITGYKIYWDTINCYSFYHVMDAGNVTSIILNNVDFNTTFAVTAYDNLLDGTYDQFEGNESWFTYDQLYNSFGVGVQQSEPSSPFAIAIYPNPMQNISYLSVQGIQPPFAVELYNEVGQLIRSEVSNSLTFLIYRKQLQPGLYLVRVKKDGTFFRTGKLLIE